VLSKAIDTGDEETVVPVPKCEVEKGQQANLHRVGDEEAD
jgi:hypothetical protein